MKRLLILMGLFGLLTGITWGQTHFQTVYSGNPYLAMNIYVTSAVIEDVALTAGDEIGIFDGEYCVGAAVVEGEIDPYLAMVAATDEASTPEVDGFTPGNPIIFRIWDSENDMEITNVAATYALGDGTFTSQGSAMVDLVGNLPEDHFTPVYFGNPYLAMNFYITAASIDDVELGAGDEIGIFDGDVCVGAGVLSAPIGDYLALVAATDDPGTPEIDGFTPGHTISYRLWDAGQELEIENVEAVYALGDGIFSSQGSAMADLAGSTSTTVPTVAHPIPDIVLDEDAAGFDVADLDTVFANPAPEDPLIYTITNAEAGVQLTLVNTSILHLELGPDWYGGATVTITASNSNSESVDDAFEITVNAVNDAPQLVSIPDQTTVEDSSIVVSIGATDVDFDLNAAETLTFTLTNNTNESLVDVAVTDDNLNDDLAELVLTVQANQHGSATITVVVTDAAGLGNSGDFTLTVNPVNDAPVLGQIQDQSTVEDSSISVSLSASDLDFDLDASETLTFTVSDNTNEGLVVATISDDNLNDESGELILTVQPDQVGTATLSVMVSDAGGLSDTTQFTLTVDPQSDAPATFDLITPPMEANVDSQQPTFTWHPASDPDVGDVLAYTLYLGTDIENYSEVYAGTDTSWTPTELLVDNSTYYWLVTVTDLAGNTTENSDGVWHFYVNTVNDPPEPVVLVTPTANSVEVTLTPEFYWEVGVDPDPGDSLFYELWIDTTSYFTNSMTIETSEHQLTLETPLMDNSEYFWKVIIADASGATVESDTMRFWTNTELEPPNPFDLVSPADLTQGLTTTPEFIWQVATDNDPQDYAVYMLVIAADSEFVSILQTIETLVDTEYTLESALTNDTQYWWKVIAMDTDSLTTESPVQSFTVGYVTTEPEAAIPTKFALHTNYPNPFNPTTTIRYDLPERSTVSLVIYNQLGQPIRTLVNSEQLAGFQSVMWDGRNNVGQQVGTGIYFYQINAGKFNQTRKMILLK